MPYELRTDPANNVLLVIYSGVVNAGELHEASHLAAERIKVSGQLRALADLTAVERFSATIGPVLEIPQSIYVEHRLSHQLRIAVLVPPNESIVELARFYELACHNRGWLARVFRNRGEALDWLANGSKT